MPLFVTPGQFSQRAGFYHQLGQLVAAGLGIIPALVQVGHTPPARSYREPIRRVLGQLARGGTLAESLERSGHWFPAFDVALIRAGEQSGRLDTCFRLLADHYTERARITRQLISDLTYPVFVFHLAIFIFPFAKFFMSGDWAVYARQTLGVLIPLYAIVALLIYAAQSRHGEKWRAGVESLLHLVPVLGTARRDLALARLAAALEALLSAGVTIVEAWALAATASGSPAFRRIVRAWRPLLNAGKTPAEGVRASPRFPVFFANQYATGEVSGKLDETLGRLQKYYQEEGTRKLHALAQWVPRMIYLAVALLIAYRVVQFWLGYFKQIQDAGGF
jgi:type II secretory pathway component PulF